MSLKTLRETPRCARRAQRKIVLKGDPTKKQGEYHELLRTKEAPTNPTTDGLRESASLPFLFASSK